MSTNSSSNRTLKRPRSHCNNKTANSVSTSVTRSTKFKGVVSQISGHWGAQIYASHQRIWLGTFKSETEAAMAYDSAAFKLRKGDSHRNFPWSAISIQEPAFQKHYTTEAVLHMIKAGSYSTKFSEFLKQQQADESQSGDKEQESNSNTAGTQFNVNNNLMKMRINGIEKCTCRKLFRKELTPSDVGKLNRLVIPKKFAVKFFPGIISAENNNNATGEEGLIQGMGNDKDVLLSFYDSFARLWKFRYCYWKSSQSFVLTRGWNGFVKDKELKAKDVITFFMCEGAQTMKNSNFILNDHKLSSSSFYLVDVSYHNKQDNGDNISSDDDTDLTHGNQEPVVVNNNNAEENTHGKTSHLSDAEVAGEKEQPDESAQLPQQSGTKKLCLRLFGVDMEI